MTPAEILSGLEEALREAGAPGFEFRLITTRKDWFRWCWSGREMHRAPLRDDFGIWCRMCHTAYVPEPMHERASPDVLRAAAMVMLNRG